MHRRNRPGPFHEGKRPIQSGISFGDVLTGDPSDYDPPPFQPPFMVAAAERRKGDELRSVQATMIEPQPVESYYQPPVVKPEAALVPVTIPGTFRPTVLVLGTIVAGGVAAGIAIGIRSGGFGGLHFQAPTFQAGTVLTRP